MTVHVAPDAPSVPARVDPEVLERPAISPLLQRIEPDHLVTELADVDELAFNVLRPDPENRLPGEQPRFRVAPVSLRGSRDLGQALRVARQRPSDSKLEIAQRLLLIGPGSLEHGAQHRMRIVREPHRTPARILDAERPFVASGIDLDDEAQE